MAKKPQSDISKAMDKSGKLARKGRYDEAVKALLPYQNDSGVRKMIDATKKLGKAVKELKANPMHKKVKFSVERKGNSIQVSAGEKRGCWPFRF
jgi:hypothetical protein